MFYPPEACHIFFFLQFADNRTWFFLWHNSQVFQNNLDCPTATIEPPVGAESKVTTYAYDKVWVENIHRLFTAICGGKSR